MFHRNIPKLVLTALAFIVLLSSASAFAAGIQNMPSIRVMEDTQTIAVSDLVPSECDSLRYIVTRVVVCTGGMCNGTGADELILGTAGNDQIDGKNGMDCIVGGNGDDALNGGNDDDILLGNNGNDSLDGGRNKDTDICYGGSGINTFNTCDLTP